MRYTFQLKGLDCANCAEKMARGIKALKGVASCDISFLTGKLVVEGADDVKDTLIEDIRRITKRIEPDVVVTAR